MSRLREEIADLDAAFAATAAGPPTRGRGESERADLSAFCPRCGLLLSLHDAAGCDPLVCGDCGTPVRVDTPVPGFACAHPLAGRARSMVRQSDRAARQERVGRHAATVAAFGAGARYEPETRTVRSVPENYYLATVDESGAFQVYTQEASTWHALGDLAKAMPYGAARADGRAVARLLGAAWARGR